MRMTFVGEWNFVTIWTDETRVEIAEYLVDITDIILIQKILN